VLRVHEPVAFELRRKGLLMSMVRLRKSPKPNVRLQSAAGVWEFCPVQTQAVFDEVRTGPPDRWRVVAYIVECSLKNKVPFCTLLRKSELPTKPGQLQTAVNFRTHVVFSDRLDFHNLRTVLSLDRLDTKSN